MNTLQNQLSLFVGIDVGKSSLDVFLAPLDYHFTIANTRDAIGKLIGVLKQHPIERIVVEATGRHEHELVFACDQARLPIVVVNPMQIRRYAQALGVQAKTDKLDANIIAQFASTIQPAVKPLPDKSTRLIKDLLIRRAELIEMATMEKNRLTIMPAALHPSIKSVLRTLNTQIDKLTSKLDEMVAQVKPWRMKTEILTSVPGVGKVLAYTLMSQLPELGHLNRKEIAALVGVAPMNKESGTYQGLRRIRGGRSQVRTVMFMAMMSAIQCNPRFKHYYQHLLAKGKRPKVALVACMRKLIVILNTMLKQETLWEEKTA